MSTAEPPVATTPISQCGQVRVVYRTSAGAVHRDWPAERIAEAVADTGGCVWIDIAADANNSAAVEALLRDLFHFHPLAIDDALRECHVPKIDDWSKYLYMVFHALDFEPGTDELQLRELDLFLGPNYLVSLHFDPIPPIDELSRLLERDEGERLKEGPDHLLYHLLDFGVADYLKAIEHLDEAIDDAQEEVFDNPSPRTLHRIFRVKRSALRLHRVIAPQREVVNRLARDEYSQIDARDRVYFRDVYDHLVRLHDITETLRDLISGALDTYLSAISNRTNDVMKTLTVVAVLFLPLNFLVGFFGMNFFGDNIHLGDGHAVHVALFVITMLTMIASPFIIWVWAKRRKWF